ncbi:hypothetical protein AB0I84_47655 [Streptomyces spectabilis]|uniref:hypothetical protein n=1 Tax=Streptomyces spectabilis TaxID=68270 RepID=UPI0033CD7824
MGTTTPHSDTDGHESPDPARLSPAELHQLGQSLAAELSDWEAATVHTTQGEDLHIAGPAGRAIGLRLLFKGRVLQTFAIGGPQPATGTGEASAGGEPLAEGARYNTSVLFTHDETPLEAALDAMRTVLLPAFDGHRPPLTSRGCRTEARPTEPAPDPAPAGPKPSTPAPKTRTRKSPATTKAAPTPKPRARKGAAKPKDSPPKQRRTSKKTATTSS